MPFHNLVEKIASGAGTSVLIDAFPQVQSLKLPEAIHTALGYGFSWVTLYGAAMAGLSRSYRKLEV
jgi:hypothetical protein